MPAGVAMAANSFGPAVMVFASVTSFINFSTPLELWITFHQIQMIVLLLVSSVYFPKLLINYLDSLKTTSFMFSMIDFRDFSALKPLFKYFDADLSYEKLKYFDVNSESIIVNLFSIAFTLSIVMVIHLITWII